MNMITVAQAMVKSLEEENISVVFGYPGAAICPFYDALFHSDINHILVRQEQHAAHSASGYARMTGKPAVCIATSGPGALNLITGIATAYMDSIPMVVITGQVSSELLGRDVFQEADITGAVESFTKYSYIVKDGTQIGRIIKEAFYLAGTGRPGPVIIDVPQDVQMEKIYFEYPKQADIRSYKPNIVGHPGQIKRVITAVKHAKHPLICAGGGVFAADAQKELFAFSKKANIPVITTMMGIGCIPSEYELNFGMLGMHGLAAANVAVKQADVLILLGARAGDRSVKNPLDFTSDAKVIHIDIDPAEIGKNLDVNIPIVGDARLVLQEMIDKVPRIDCDEWIASLQALKAKKHTNSKTSGFVNPKEFIAQLSQKADNDAVVAVDVGQNQIWAANYFQIREGRFLTSGGMGTMGYAIPAAVGAKLAEPQKQVFSICGDGSFQMQMMELGTIAQNHVGVKMVVFTNNALGMVKEVQNRLYQGNEIGVSLAGNPDITQLAQSYGIPSRKLTSMEGYGDAINELLQAEGPFLLECMVHPDESTL